MRKSLLLSVMLLVCTLAFAQTQKGQIQLGGVFNYTQQDFGTQTNTNFNFIPQAGYFLSDNTSIGVVFNISSIKTESGIVTNKRDSFGFGVFARFHKSVAEKLYFFLQPSISFGTGTTERVGATTDINDTSIEISPGAIYFLSPKLALEMRAGSLFYRSSKETDNGTESKLNSYGLSLNLASINFGVNFYL